VGPENPGRRCKCRRIPEKDPEDRTSVPVPRERMPSCSEQRRSRAKRDSHYIEKSNYCTTKMREREKTKGAVKRSTEEEVLRSVIKVINAINS